MQATDMEGNELVQVLTEEQIREILNPKNLTGWEKRFVETYRAQGDSDREIAEWLMMMS